jgi:hypothetical protein
MALDLNALKLKQSQLNNTNQNKNLFWKPKPGKQTVRIIPYKFCPENPFVELKFHYGLNGKTYLSPDSFNRPDPIVEFSNQLKKTGNKEDWKLGRQYEPKMRTYAPIIVRGEESEGVRFWGFGKQVYQEILSIINDPDYGDITDLANGRDITVEFKEAVPGGKDFPETSIRIKPNQSPAVDPTNKALMEMLTKQTDILSLYEEKTYDELKQIMKDAHRTDKSESSDATPKSETPSASPFVNTTAAPAPAQSGTTVPSSNKDIESAFDNLFAKKS